MGNTEAPAANRKLLEKARINCRRGVGEHLVTTFLAAPRLLDVLAFLIPLKANAVRCETHNAVAPTARPAAKVNTSGEFVTEVMTSTRPHVPSTKTNDCLMHLGQRPRFAFSAANICSTTAMIAILRN
jgi:hypothetical protein